MILGVILDDSQWFMNHSEMIVGWLLEIGGNS